MSEAKVALLRGINVGSAKRIAMAELRRLFEDLGYRGVRTLLNTGNVVFSGEVAGRGDEGDRLEAVIAERLSVTTRVTVIPAKELRTTLRANPLEAVADNPSRLLLMFLCDAQAVRAAKALLAESWDPEALVIVRRVAWIWCARGIIPSRLWAAANRVVGDAGTARNLATVTKLLALVDEK